MTDTELITAAVRSSRLSARSFARYLMGRDERTGRAWKSGGPIPPNAREWLERWLALSDDERRLVVGVFVPGRADTGRLRA